MKRQRLAKLATVAMVFCLCPSSASAHLNSTGMGPVYDGLLHFLLSPEDIVPVVALAMFAGLRGVEYGRRALFLLPASWFVGCMLGTVATTRATSWPLAAISFLVFGGLVAGNARLSLRVMTGLASVLGYGWMNGAGMRWSVSLVGAYAGLVGGIFVIVALVSAFVIMLRPQWARVAVRVVGSWIVASGLLLLGWASRRG
jgi:HupE / UreJ protein